MSKATPKLKLKRKQSITSQKPTAAADRQASLDLDHDLDDLETSVNVQVRQREPSPERGRSKFDMLKEQATGTLQKGIEGIKRPMSSLLKRPGSRAGSKDRSGTRSASKDRELENIELPVDNEYISDSKPNSAGPKMPRKTTESWADDDTKPIRPASGIVKSGSKGRLNQSPNRNMLSATSDPVDGYVPQGGGESTMVELPDLGRDAARTPDIPRLEEMQSNEFGSNVAQAPSVALNKMATYKDLDGELSKNAAFQNLDGLDLNLLTKCLCPESEIRDEKVPWTWDYLFTSVCGDLRRDWVDDDQIDEGQPNDDDNDQMETGN